MRLDNKPIDEAIEDVRCHSEQSGGRGFVGVKHASKTCSECGHKTYPESESKPYQWQKGDDWEPRVRQMLEFG